MNLVSKGGAGASKTFVTVPKLEYKYSARRNQPPLRAYSRPPPAAHPVRTVVLTVLAGAMKKFGPGTKLWLRFQLAKATPPVAKIKRRSVASTPARPLTLLIHRTLALSVN